MRNPAYQIISNDTILEPNVRLSPFINLWGCHIGEDSSVGAFTEIGRGVTIGRDCKIAAHVFIPPGVTIGDEVFIGPNTTFTNDKYPSAVGDWTMLYTTVNKGASIGAHVVVLPGVTIGAGALIGAGTIVKADVPAKTRIHAVQKELFT
jgi:acetyltransferase-like isoleucine patch superfamily enzyme